MFLVAGLFLSWLSKIILKQFIVQVLYIALHVILSILNKTSL